ncbi:AsnC family transcriptional regulator [Candidatus Woesearchaeota archaeon]|nr:AsnC family transcriptional regulator [Candidatus Woesearchaeota archaeon]
MYEMTYIFEIFINMSYFLVDMPVKTKLTSRNLDKKDREILMILQDNSRESLTNIARKVGLSIDSVKKRIKEMQRKGIFDFSMLNINPRAIGFPLIADVKIKLHNITEKEKTYFISHLKSHPRVIDLLSIMGDYDLTCVLIAKDTNELENMSTDIRQKFSNMIADWRGMLILKTHKFEYYNLS